MLHKYMLEIASVMFIAVISMALNHWYGKELIKARELTNKQAETIEMLRGELQKYAAIEKIINSRCLDNLEPFLMEVE